MNTDAQRDLQSFWQLCFERPVYVDTHKLSPQLNSLADIEALLWLHFGVELGIFSSDGADATIRASRQRLSTSGKDVRRLGVSHFFASEVRNFLDQARELTSISDIRYTTRLAKNLVNSLPLGILFREIAASTREPLLLLFTDLITFEDEDKWNDLLRVDPDPDNVIKGEGNTSDLLFAGYLRFLDHMNWTRELLQYCHEESSSEHARFELTRRLRAIHMWRLNLVDAEVKTRFRQLTSEFLLQLNWDEDLEYLDFDTREVVNRIEWICADWTGADAFPLGLRPEHRPKRRFGTG
jgi:hypothetical protein